MDPLQKRKQAGLCRLRTERKAVDAVPPQGIQKRRGDRAGVAFAGTFRVRKKIELVPDSGQQPFHQRRRQQRRRAPANIESSDGSINMPAFFRFPQNGVHIRFFVLFPSGEGSEIAVGALSDAEGNMHIQTDFFFHSSETAYTSFMQETSAVPFFRIPRKPVTAWPPSRCPMLMGVNRRLPRSAR